MNTKVELLKTNSEVFENDSKTCNTKSRVSSERLNAINNSVKEAAQNTKYGGFIYENIAETNSRFRNFAFTDFGKSIELKDSIKYILYGEEEAPTTGKLHKQGVMIFKNGKTVKAVRKIFPGVHIEVCKKNLLANARYCIKDGTWVELGLRPPSLNKIFREKIKESNTAEWKIICVKWDDGLKYGKIQTWNETEKEMALMRKIAKVIHEDYQHKTIYIFKDDILYKEFKIENRRMIEI